MPLETDEADLPPVKPLVPCLVCATPTNIRPICERYQLCIGCMADWFEDKRFQGGDLEANAKLTVGWLAERKRERSAA